MPRRSPPCSARLVLDGDRAVAICESLLVRRGDSGYRGWRAAASRFELARTPQGRRITRRTMRALDGGAAARDLLSNTLPEATG